MSSPLARLVVVSGVGIAAVRRGHFQDRGLNAKIELSVERDRSNSERPIRVMPKEQGK